LQEDKPSTHQNVCGGRFYGWRSNGKSSIKELFNIETGQEMHNKMRSSLTSFSGLRLKVRRRKT
jgi:hypothetical protein